MHTVCTTANKKQQHVSSGCVQELVAVQNASKDPTIEKFPVDILQTDYEKSVVDQALAAFVSEAKRMDGNYYPGTSFVGHFDHLFTFLHGTGLQSEFVLTIHSLALFDHLFFYHFLSRFIFPAMDCLLEHSIPCS